MKFSIQRKHIRAMLHLSAKKDIRYYLQGVNVVRDNRGTYLEATDGHILGRLSIDGIRSDIKQNVVLPTDQLIKLKGTKKQGEEWLHFSVDGLAVECICGESTMRFSAHDARFPDADRVIPLVFKEEDIKPATFNPDLLSRFVDFSEEIYGKRQIPQLLQRGTNSIIVSFSLDDNFVGVMMPMRAECTAKVPDWCYLPSVKPVENQPVEA
jgi:DNA polymerase III sliding clamp (beta) subunit (PCNA family)